MGKKKPRWENTGASAHGATPKGHSQRFGIAYFRHESPSVNRR